MRGRARLGGAVALGLFALVATTLPPAVGATVAPARTNGGTCPWASPAYDAAHTPAQLAAMVIPRMSLADKLDLLDLSAARGYENSTVAIPSLCIPALTLQDGPNGLAYGDTGVTQLPASLALAATFDTGLAKRYGALEGNEARRQGVDVIQGPNLNIARVAQSGREFEGYGEDPDLVSAMGVADIEGIQSQGVMANAKHFTAYNQETDRATLNESVTNRTLEEIYLPPFQAAVTEANVASVMCAYGSINGVSDCSNSRLYHLLDKWGFRGFVRSDLDAVVDAPGAFKAGMDQIKPAASRQLTEAIGNGTLPESRIDDAITRILTEMFTYGMIQRPIVGKIRTKVTTAAHAQTSLTLAERSMVLLKNSDNVLPLSPKHPGTIAVIGSDAASGAMTAGFGSAHVVAKWRSTPLDAIRAAVGPKTKVLYAAGGASTSPAPMISHSRWKGPWAPQAFNRAAKLLRPDLLHAIVGTGSFEGAQVLLRHATTTITVPTTGEYVFSLASNGDAWLSLGGDSLISNPGLHSRSAWSSGTALRRGKRYTLSVSWYAGNRTGMPVVGMRSASPSIAAAVAAARRAKVAIVFANDISMEGTDRPSLSLPSDENALISAVAAANRHTVVVLNTGGAVYMPWIGKVAAVLEGWYPGAEDGRATAAVLFGKVDPSGHLPVTFPQSASELPTHLRDAFPGNDGAVSYAEGLDVGYRYFQARGLAPLFPFGFGLSYASFVLGDLEATSSSAGVDATVNVTNTGHRSGTEVVQGYLVFPAAAGEPPLQLKAFATVTLAAGESKSVALELPPSAFEAYLTGGWQTVPGTYELAVGTASDSLPLVTELAAPVTVTPTSSKAPPIP